MSTQVEDLPKQYDHAAAEERWYRFWEEKGYFHSEPNPAKKPYTIVIPPPNVTGALHLGHALNNTLQDILIRQKRMQGFETLWLPGSTTPASPRKRSSSAACWRKRTQPPRPRPPRAGRADLAMEKRIRSPHPRPTEADGL